ncbi:MAG: hypothetical protein PHU63_01850 [Candidatus ainarchaeum sp.]|nr:hypothetical protein [Candidatus ainarchaeum sp.]
MVKLKKASITYRKTKRLIKRIGSKVSKFMMSTLLIGGLLLGAPTRANADSSIELMVGHSQTSLDIKAGAPLTEKIEIFGRFMPSIDYKGHISNFGLIDLTLKINNCLNFLTEVQFVGGKIIPRGGLQYFGNFGSLMLFNAVSLSAIENPDVENVSILSLTPALTETLSLLAQIENITNFGTGGHNFSIQRLRLGVTLSDLSFGPAVDLMEVGNIPSLEDGTVTYVLGAFVLKSF